MFRFLINLLNIPGITITGSNCTKKNRRRRYFHKRK